MDVFFFFDEEAGTTVPVSVSDVVAVLTDSTDVKQYIKKLRLRDKELNNSWGTICTLTPMRASDGKNYRLE